MQMSTTHDVAVLLLCGRADDANSSTSINLAMLHLYGQGVLVLVMGIFGIIGNTLSIITISSMHTLSVFHKLLITLAVFDATFIITDGLFTVQSAFRLVMPWFYKIFPIIIYPIAGFSMTGSTYSCLSIAADRYFGICHPNRDYCFKTYHFYLLGILITCTVIDLPRFFEIQTVFDDLGEAVGLAYTELRTDEMYVVAYVMWYRLLTTIVIPFVIMLFFNAKVFNYYRKNSLQSHQHQERSLLIIFSCITITSFICHLPRAILNIHEFQLHHNQALCQSLYNTDFVEPLWARITYHIEKILLIFNASANFLYYCFSGHEFRNKFCAVLRCHPNQAHQLDRERLRHSTQYTAISKSCTRETHEENNALMEKGVHTFEVELLSNEFQLEQQAIPYENNIFEQFLGHIYRDHEKTVQKCELQSISLHKEY